MKVALVAGLLVASPYIIYVLFRFISPALYDNERRAGIRLIGASYTMFMIGLVVNYLLVFPLTVRFLGTYSVSADITNLLTLSSYVDTLLLLSLVFGIIFEIPVVAWLLARFGMLKASWMSQYRRHAIVAILIIAAVITPTADIMTLFVVSLPIWLLYEASIWIVKWTSPPAPSPVMEGSSP
jgi:sec-independent protein translocase protein TatC